MARTINNPAQTSLFTPKASWAPPSMADMPSWSGVRRVALDIETCDPNLKTHGPSVRTGGYITGISFALQDGPKHYLPMRHAGGDNLPAEQVLDYIKQQCRSFDGEITGANLAYDLDYLTHAGVLFPFAVFRDVQIAEALLWEHHQSYSLDNIAKRRGFPGKDEALLKEASAALGFNPKSDMWKLPARYVGAYAEQDAALCLDILAQQEQEIAEQDLHQIWDLESRVLPVLIKMKQRGVRVNLDKLEKIVAWATQQELEAQKFIKDQTGIAVARLDQAVDVLPVLQHLGIATGLTSKGKAQVDKFLLAGVKHPVTDAILHGRKVGKLRDTFAQSVYHYQINGRIHCNFNQLPREDDSGGGVVGARSGRLSCTDPNLQQQPARDEFASTWRAIYEPEDGCLWGALDYSQQEPRWTTHYAASSPIKSRDIAKKAAQAYWDDPKIDNHQFMADLTGLPRKFAKNLYLGLCYGEGGAKLCRDLGQEPKWACRRTQGRDVVFELFDTRADALAQKLVHGHSWNYRVFETANEEAKAIIDTFNSRAPFIKELAQLAEAKAKTYGYIKTYGGRRCRFPQLENGEFDWTYRALNRIIQGSSADQVKKAIVVIDQQMPDTFLQLQVHDELDGSFRDRAEAEAVAEIMRTCVPNTAVPFRVDVELGPSWGEAK